MISLKKLIFVALFGLLSMPGISFAAAGDCRNLLLRSLAENIYDNVGSEDGVIIASDSLVEFFAKNIDICKEYLLARTTDEDIHIADNDLTVDIRWDYVVEEVAAAMTISSGRKNLFVCENDRSYQAGIDVALWAATVAAAIYSFGTGGVAIQGVKAGITQGAKNLVKIGVKKGVKTAAAESIATRVGADIAGKTAAKTAAADLAATTAANLAKKEAAAMAAKTAAETAARQALNQFNRHAGTVAARNALKSGGAKHISEKMLETELRKTAGSSAASAAAKKEAQDALDLLAKRQTAGAARKTAQQAYKTAAAETATGNAAQAANIAAAESALVAETAKATAALNRILAIFAISTPIAAAGGIAAAYSFLESGFDPKIMNCTDTDKNNGCYTSCTKDNLGSPNDDLNNKVFKPVFGKNLCVDENANYVLREIETGLPVPGQVFVATNEKLWERAKKIINDQVKDKGNCDYNEDDIDLYIGAPIYDPATLEPQAEGMALIIDGMRIDD